MNIKDKSQKKHGNNQSNVHKAHHRSILQSHDIEITVLYLSTYMISNYTFCSCIRMVILTVRALFKNFF